MLHGWCISSTAQLSGMHCGWCGLDKRPPIKVAERHREPATVAFAITSVGPCNCLVLLGG